MCVSVCRFEFATCHRCLLLKKHCVHTEFGHCVKERITVEMAGRVLRVCDVCCRVIPKLNSQEFNVFQHSEKLCFEMVTSRVFFATKQYNLKLTKYLCHLLPPKNFNPLASIYFESCLNFII